MQKEGTSMAMPQPQPTTTAMPTTPTTTRVSTMMKTPRMGGSHQGTTNTRDDTAQVATTSAEQKNSLFSPSMYSCNLTKESDFLDSC